MSVWLDKKPAEDKLLSEIAKKCGNCVFCSRAEIFLPYADLNRLQNVARDVMSAKPGSVLLHSEGVIDVLTLLEHFQNEKVYCRRERCWTHFLDVACCFWQPRKNSGV